MRDRHDYYLLQLKKKKHVIHPMQINIEKENSIMSKIRKYALCVRLMLFAGWSGN